MCRGKTAAVPQTPLPERPHSSSSDWPSKHRRAETGPSLSLLATVGVWRLASSRSSRSHTRWREDPCDHPERTKPDHLHLSQRPLSLRAAIKRTRTNSQGDHTRERRRPEITIISAEPLVSNSWFSGNSVVFPHPPQSGWSAGIQAVPQVIQEKTQEEHIVKPTAAPRRTTCTTTSATQTDPVGEDTGAAAAPQSAGKRPAGKKPQKPPRPSLSKPVDREPVGTNTPVSINTEDQSDAESDVKQPDQSGSSCIRSVTVHWDILSSSPDSEHSRRPVPLPRTKPPKPAITEEVKVQTLVKLSEHCDRIQSDPEVVSSNKYLKELLEVFSTDNECAENGTNANQSDESSRGEDAGGEMNANHSQRNIRARIQAFETQVSTEEGNAVELAKPEPAPRKPINKPTVAAKPSVALRPQLNQSVDDDYQNVSIANIPQIPSPAPRPLPPRKSVELPVKEELETLFRKTSIPKRPGLSVLTRANSIHEEDTPPVPLTPPVKPFKEPLKPNLNINNHNSVSVTENVYVDSPLNPIQVKPLRNVDSNGGSLPRQSMTRRPTTIRVPSKTSSLSDNFEVSAPPLPAQKPIGLLNSSVNPTQSQTPTFPHQEFIPVRPEPSLPPRRLKSSNTLPPRPHPAKTGPGKPPTPSLQAIGRSQSAHWEASPIPQTQKPHRKGPVLPPRPKPGHRLYNKYILQLPHGIASFDYNGSNTGELSFQKNEVLLLLDEIDHNTFECQVGDTRGRVHKSHMVVITPLASVSHMPPPQDADSGGTGSELEVQAIHDFTPVGEGELGLRAGDVATMVEQVDSDWYRGTCKGSTGFFPTNYVKVLSNSPKPLPKRKARPPSAAVSGPRCVAKFDFAGENDEELTFSEGDVIQLMAFVGQDWARGKIGVSSGIFPLNFVEVIEDLPPAPSQQKRQSIGIPLPGMAASPSTHLEVAKPAQASPSGVEWAVARYDYAGNSDGDLGFQQGDRILISRHIDAEWSCGRLNGSEGLFPRAFVESSAGQQSDNQQSGAAAGSRGRAMFNFTAECEEELSLQVGDIVTGLEPVDEEWFLGDLRGKRALVPRNYVQVLE
ncbi:SH3 domain-containing protein 19 isoform X2 [Cyclopterus lumpus]|uniref:SH3 domain-containing protein 19 isoform X2 n=1 Tax=Cyclopterus lumpus TaxID=8103 RepID=UPI0014861FAA|nr:SH3 domain-containing protein 19 isoform X2 [Cyclopterus lumpus]